jgi:hypothetical protein
MIDYSKDKYFSLILHKLDVDQSTVNSSSVNFSCPFCKEGSSLGRKRRAFIYKDSNYKFWCFNCSRSMNFESFLKEIDSELFRQYFSENKEILMKEFLSKPVYEKKAKKEIITEVDDTVYMEFNPSEFVKVEQTHSPMEYVKSRKIPQKFWDDIYVYVGAVNDETRLYTNAIIFPIRKNGKITGFVSRNIHTKFFHKHKAGENNILIYNYYDVNKHMTVYITESIIDSLFVENSMALNGVSINKKLLNGFFDPVFILDNDSEGTSHTGLKKSKERVEKGYKVFVMPTELKRFKDLNELIISGFPEEKIMGLIQKNTFSGTEALLRLALNY